MTIRREKNLGKEEDIVFMVMAEQVNIGKVEVKEVLVKLVENLANINIHGY